MPMPTVGDPAPDFEAKTDQGEILHLSELRGQVVVLYFYPKADTPGCTTEACGFRDDYGAYLEHGAAVVGVSPDSVKKQARFKEKWSLPFTLLADEDHAICDLYGVWGPKKFMGREYEGVHRTTFLIDQEGKIAQVFENVSPDRHSQEVLEAVIALR